MDKSDGKRYRIKNNINHFTPLYKSDNEEGTKYRTKNKTPIIVLSEREKGKNNKGFFKKINEEY